MILDLNIQSEQDKAQVYFDFLIKDKAKIELKKIPKRRTLKQNSYVHKLFTLWGSNFGYTTEEAKITVKRQLGYTYQKDGQEYFTPTSGMDTKQLTEFIDKFRNWSAHNGYYLPSADEMGTNWEYYAREIERAEIMQKRYGY